MRTVKAFVEPGALLVVLLAVGFFTHTGLVDDAYIFARFADNLAEGAGLRFNPSGERIEGFTSFAWLGLLALWRAGGGAALTAARWAGVALAALSIWIVARGPIGRERWWLGALLATSPIVAYWAGTGMDAAAFMAATALVGAAVLREPFSPWIAGLAVGASAWVRPEGLLVLFPWVLLVAIVLGERQRRIRNASIVLAAVALVVAPQIALRSWLFDAWLPNTFFAKAALGPVERLVHGSKYFVRQVPVLAGWLVLAAACIRTARARGDRRAQALLAGAGIWAAYVAAIGGDHFALGRFVLPLLVLIALAAQRLFASASAP